MRGSLLRQLVLACVTGILYPLCFPDFDLGWLAWVVLLPLHLALDGAAPRRACWLGWLTGLIAFAGTMYWVVTAMHLYGKLPTALSYTAMLLLTAYLGLYVAIYAASVSWLRKTAFAFTGAPFIWVALEWLRTYLFSGLPWALLGYSQYQWLPVIQIADHTGVYGVSFLVVLVNAALAELALWTLERRRGQTPGTFPRLSPAAAVLVRKHGVPLLFGSPALRYYPNGRPYLLNSAYLLSPDSRILGRYDKRHLVPFGEYIPARTSLFFLDKLVEGIGDFEPGTVPTILEVPLKSRDASGGLPARFGVVICYEVIFPDVVREFAKRGAEFMVTITNDAWYGVSSAPYQHFGMVVLRAVENRVAFARAANTGISGFIDPQGRILVATTIFSEQAITGVIPLGRTRTFYTRYGDAFAYTCAIITGLLLLAAQLRLGRSEWR